MKSIRVSSHCVFTVLVLSLAVQTLLIPMPVQADPAPVEDIGQAEEGFSTLRNAPSAAEAGAYASANSSATNVSASSDPYYRMQLLMEEIRQLRGLLEEQGNELALLKKRQREDYLDLDGRLMALNGAGTVTSPPADMIDGAGPTLNPAPDTTTLLPSNQNGASTRNVPPATSSGVAAGGMAEKAAYDHAYGLLKARQIDEAKVALKQFLRDYPQGVYAANAHYWLGEVHLLAGELPGAEAEFLAVVEQYPGHRKVNDATFKLGKVYYLQDKRDKSRVLLERVAGGSDSAARLAQDFLLRNF